MVMDKLSSSSGYGGGGGSAPAPDGFEMATQGVTRLPTRAAVERRFTSQALIHIRVIALQAVLVLRAWALAPKAPPLTTLTAVRAAQV